MKGAYAVFGAGSFGSKVAMELSAAGHHVVVVDNDREAIMASTSSHSTQRMRPERRFSATNPNILTGSFADD